MKQIMFTRLAPPYFFLLFSVISGTAAAQAQNQPPPTTQIPETLISEWRTIGVDPDVSRQLYRRFIRSREVLFRKWASQNPASNTLEAFAANGPGKVLPLLKSFAAKTGVSATSKPAAVGASIVYEPVLCRVGGRYMLHLSAADTVLGTLRGAANLSYDSREFERDARDPSRENNLSEALTTLAGMINISGDGTTQDNSALHVGLAVAKGYTRRDEGSAMCALALMSEYLLAQKFTVVRPWGNETLGKIRNSLQLPAALRRPTRTLSVRWELPRSPKFGQPPQDPLILKATIDVAESVLGRSLPVIPETEWTGRVGLGGSITLTPGNTKLLDFLNQERAALSLAEAPQVAKINRAWVYLDKGRAYGLQMNDRLVISGGARDYAAAIKGHVVGFYGPEKKVISPRGFPVNEGAIVYIRKGQAETKIGQTFIFDETVFPAPYPAGGQ